MSEPATGAPRDCWPIAGPAALCRAIETGQLDRDLTGVIDTINRRTSTIARNRTAAALARLPLGQRVRLDNRVKPHYLRGETATVHELDGDDVVVLLDRVVGRFTSRHVSCAPEVLEVIDDA